jgi:hypothetical protein
MSELSHQKRSRKAILAATWTLPTRTEVIKPFRVVNIGDAINVKIVSRRNDKRYVMRTCN